MRVYRQHTNSPAKGKGSLHLLIRTCIAQHISLGPRLDALLSRLLASYSDPKEAGGRLAIIDVASGKLQHLQTPYSSHGGMSVQV